MRWPRWLLPFVSVTALAGTGLVVDQWRLRPVPIPKPTSADSLAGVVARIAGGDSAVVGRVRWYRSPERALLWVPSEAYAYKHVTLPDRVPIAARADLAAYSITFAKGTAAEAEMVKHELAHLLIPVAGHPGDVFTKLEAYRGR